MSKYKFIVLRSPEEKAQGLQGVKKLPANTFLIFENTEPGEFFHTYNCFINIDIAAVDGNGLILAIWSCEPGLPKIGPMPLGTQAVVETHGGWLRKNGINEGVNIYRKLIQ